MNIRLMALAGGIDYTEKKKKKINPRIIHNEKTLNLQPLLNQKYPKSGNGVQS